MISVIVPICNVEPYLHQCIDSIINQTYTDLEILLIDDGSTDKSGQIADSYDDPRIRVFHTTNHGLSVARNLGINHAQGEFISFVDADDWIEADLLSHAVSQIEDADILCYQYNDNQFQLGNYTGLEATIALINSKLPDTAWSKLYRKKCFLFIRFPESQVYEDVATIYKLFLNSKQVKCIDEHGYHYRYRNDSLSHTRDIHNTIDSWRAHFCRFSDCQNLVDNKTRLKLHLDCALTISRAWALRNTISGLKNESSVYSNMTSFAKEHLTLSIPLPLHIRVGVFSLPSIRMSCLSGWQINYCLFINSLGAHFNLLLFLSGN